MQLLRAKRWEKLEAHFKKTPAKSEQQIYSLGLALMHNANETTKKKLFMALRHFLALSQYNCKAIKEIKEEKASISQLRVRFEGCFKQIASSSLRGSLQRWMALRLHTLAEKHRSTLGVPILQHLIRILSIRNQDKDLDYISEKIFQNRLKYYIVNQKYTQAKELASRSELLPLDSHFSNFMRARSFAYAKSPRAIQLYLQVAQKTRTAWLQNSIQKDLRLFYPQFWKQSYWTQKNPGSERRKLLALSATWRNAKNRNILQFAKKTYSTAAILRSTKERLVEKDGIFLIHTQRSADLVLLSQKQKTYLNENGDVLEVWLDTIEKKKSYKAAVWNALKKHTLDLLSEFQGIFPQYSDIWFAYLQLREYKENPKQIAGKTYSKDLLLATLNYIQSFPHHIRSADLLLKILLKGALLQKNSTIQWANADFWELARQKIPNYTQSGRFFYWLGRYYQTHGKLKEAQRIQEQIYALAPASFYAVKQPFIQSSYLKDKPLQAKFNSKQVLRDWKRSWGTVDSRQSYMDWLSQQIYQLGEPGLAKLSKFLSNQKLYLDPQAKKLWERIQNRFQTQTPDPLALLLFELGEWEAGTHAYTFEQNKHNHAQSDRNLDIFLLGYRTHTLNVQIYYLRRLMYTSRVSPDPFSLPRELSTLLYPRPYRGQIQKLSIKYQVDIYYLYAIMHQESLFRERAISSAGAAGLMQIMPSTGLWLGEKAKAFLNKNVTRKNLEEPNINIELGTYYLRELLNKEGGDFFWASIAYNGGPGNKRKWKQLYDMPSKDAESDFYYFLERLPVRESRNYCRKTFANYFRYTTMYNLWK